MSELSPEPVKTFSIGFAERSYDELPYARIIARQCRTDHHELVIPPRVHDWVDAMADYFDEPFADSSAVAVYAVSQLAAQHVKVALSGDGGDEVFGGYATYQADALAALYRRLPQALGRRLIPWLVDKLPVSDGKVSLDFKLRRFVAGGSLDPLPAHYAWKEFLREEEKRSLYSTEWRDAHETALRPTVELMQHHYDRFADADAVNRILYVDSKVQLVDDMLTKVDRMSMAHSLEVRVPLLDLGLVEFMASLPGNLKVRRLKLKYLMKRVAKRLLPPEILSRPKSGFHVPIPRWIKHDLRDLVHDALAPERIARQGFFEPAAIARMIDDHQRGRRDHSRNIWNLLMLSLWHDRHAEPAANARTRPHRMHQVSTVAAP